MEDYEKELFSLVHRIDYMVDDSRQAKIFLHGLDEEVQAKVAMWKPTTMGQTSILAR